jgi:hypothetical protein
MDSPSSLIRDASTLKMRESSFLIRESSWDTATAAEHRAAALSSGFRRGALLRIRGLPLGMATEAVLQLLSTRGVPPSMTLLSLSADGTPNGDAWVCVERVRAPNDL